MIRCSDASPWFVARLLGGVVRARLLGLGHDLALGGREALRRLLRELARLAHGLVLAAGPAPVVDGAAGSEAGGARAPQLALERLRRVPSMVNSSIGSFVSLVEEIPRCARQT